FAGRGPVQVQAHQGEVVLVAHKDVRITSVEGRIRIQAKKKVVLIGGGSYTEWSAEGIRHGTAGSWQEHAAMHAQVGPMSRPVETRAFEAANLYQAHYVLRSQRDHAVLVHHPYKLTLPSGETWVGRTDDRGQTATAFTRNPDEVHLQALDTRPPQQEPWHLSGGDSPAIQADYRDDESTLPPI
ncbi:DUF2345 domain-containing protein, partial [Pseudacidovorax intermedius]